MLHIYDLNRCKSDDLQYLRYYKDKIGPKPSCEEIFS